MEWKTIDTAPKDGTPFLGFDPTHTEAKIYVLSYDPGVSYIGELESCSHDACYREYAGETYFQWNPTHWMPLPAPPKD